MKSSTGRLTAAALMRSTQSRTFQEIYALELWGKPELRGARIPLASAALAEDPIRCQAYRRWAVPSSVSQSQIERPRTQILTRLAICFRHGARWLADL
jgi:hypothetical protein